jgi:phage host-nuclease inhibitor protein Gam
MNQPQVVSKEDALKAMEDYAEASFEISKLDAQERIKVNKINDDYSKQRAPYEERMQMAQAKVEAYANDNRDELLQDGAKSTLFGAGKISWKLSPAKIILNGAKKWDEVLVRLKKKYPQFVRTKEEIDKSQLLKEAKQMKEKDLERLGIALHQEEKFSIKL